MLQVASSDDSKGPAKPVASYEDVLAIERTTLAERNLPETPYEMLRRGAAIAPAAPALTFFADAARYEQATVWSHREFFRRITEAGNLFRRLGVERGDAVAFVLPNLPETHLAIWGGEAAGIAFAISPLLEAPQMAGLLKAVEPKLIVTLAPTPGSDLWRKVAAAAEGLARLRAVLSVDMAPYVPADQAPALRALARSETAAFKVPVLDFHAEAEIESGDALNFEPPKPGDISSYFCTGGTTGLPRIARRTHFSEAFDAWAMTSFREDLFGAGKTILCGLPLFHVNGQLVTGLAPWSKGAHVVMATPQGYRGPGVIANFWALVEHFRISLFSGVPTVYSALLQAPLAGRNLASLEAAICGAAPMPVQLFHDFERATGVRILEGYGLTEGACASSLTPYDAPPRIGSIGLRFPYQDMRALILDADNAYVRDAENDEIGVIAIRGPNVFAGYLDPAHNTGIWIERHGERWLNTGDLGRQDADGYFWLTGRRKELIIRGGHNIDPKIIEDALQKHPAVGLVAAVGSPDAYAGELPVAYVQLKPGLVVTEAELLEHAARTIPEKAAVPKRVKISSSLPTTAVGKLFKPALVEREIEETIRAEAKKVGAELASVRVERDPHKGLHAIVAAEGADALKVAIDRYAFKAEVSAALH
ncbi:MAG TPA: acyl-CoA synthetase [Roseiarcus sp.]|nr:acyl-CoA synthetase [Roseiarcus sp.]